ncbi:MAG: hypothetical protein ABI843_03430 [Dokdonella sp.]
MQKRQAFGTLHDNLSALAARVYIGTFEAPILVWADDVGEVFGVHPSKSPQVPATWIAGTFDSDVQHSDIEDDLRMLLRERAKDWIVD